MNNINGILNNLKCDFTKNSVDVESKAIDMYVMNKKHNGILLAKYLVFDFIENPEVLEQISAEDSIFSEFQRINIAPTFFSHRDDLRWNIYTLFMVKDKKVLTNEVTSIEKDEEYSRKFILNTEELGEFLKNGFLGKLDKSVEQTIKTNFLLEWETILGDHDLNGCLYNKMKTESVIEYIEDGKPIRPSGRPLINKSETKSRNDLFVNRIESLEMTSFREHCFGKNFSYSPSLINLISGSNGSGKSSLCEAISSGMTGENISGKCKSREIINIKCQGKRNDLICLSSQKSAKEKKECDLAWYGTTTTGNKSNLHENFSIFNYLHSNAAHKGLNDNLDVLLKNIMYGEETTKAWEVIKNYMDKFSQYQKAHNASRNKTKEDIEELRSKLQQIEVSNKSYALDIIDTFGFFDKYSEEVSYQTKLNDLNSLSFAVAGLEEITKTCNNLNSVPQLINSHNLLIEGRDSLNQKYTKLKEVEDQIARLNIQTKNIGSEIKNNIDAKVELEQLLEEYKEYDYTKFDNKIAMEKFRFDAISNENNFRCMHESLKEFSIFNDYNKAISISEDELDKANNELSEKQKIKAELSQSISLKKNDVELSKQILTEISALGGKYLAKHADTGECPLCGHDYGAPNDIKEAINKVRSLGANMDFELENLITREKTLLEEVRELEERKSIQNKYSNFVSEMEKHNITQYVENPGDFYGLCYSKMEELRGQVEKETPIVGFLEKLNSNVIFAKYIEQDDISLFSTYITETLKKHDLRQKAMREEADLISKKETALQNEIESFPMIKHELSKINEELIISQKAYESVKFIIDNYPEFKNISNIQNWVFNYKNLKATISGLVEAEKGNLIKSGYMAQLSEKTQELKKETESLNRCKKAIDAFNSLPTLEKNMDKFIEDNAANIERIFKMIHRPAEFTDIVILGGKVQFTRKTTEEKIDIKNVSTGQAISLVFAITLCLHFSAVNAPKFLIFDEPVANLDDMHIMNLIDILREIALSGVQLFITTSNDQVATYFRRKFSCFNEEFKQLDILRTDENPSVFYEKIYSPYKEEPVVNKEITAQH